jgi:hypothetical protein
MAFKMTLRIRVAINATVTMDGCTVPTRLHGPMMPAIGVRSSATLTMTNCTSGQSIAFAGRRY